MSSKPILFFDGYCGLCNLAVDFLLRIDHRGALRFSALQGKKAQENLGEQLLDVNTVVLYREGKAALVKSDAVLQAFIEIGGGWKFVYVFSIVPTFIRDFVYDVIAKNRYKIFGKKDTCRIPTPEERQRFVD